MSYKHIKYIAIIFAGFLLFGTAPVEFGAENTFFHGYLIPKPVISIGIGVNLEELKVTASSGMKIYNVGPVYDLIADDTREALIKSTGAKITEKFVILLANTNNRAEAERLASELQARVSGNIFLEEESEAGAGGVFSIKVGDFLTRGEALEKVKEIQGLGYADAWIECEEVPESGLKPFWLLTEGRLHTMSDDSTLYFIPANPESLLAKNGRRYRGIFILKNSRRGLTLVNVINLEEYLKSVVPGELSPLEFPAIEALKAQAVAARTYALKNMGQYQSSGFDLIHTPRSQVYLGVSAEYPLTTRAVEETRGEVMLYKGELINALYTSTCGGRTENVENVFNGPALPYLRSVECSFEKQPEYHIDTDSPALPVILGQYDASFETALAVSLGIVQPTAEPFDFKAPVRAGELSAWVANAQDLLGFDTSDVPVDEAGLNYLKLAEFFVASFGWQERVEQLILPSEIEFLSESWPQSEAAARNSLAYCLQDGLFPAFDRSDASAAARPVTRAEAAVALARLAVSQKDFFETGLFRSSAKNSIEVGDAADKKMLTLASRMFLINNHEGRPSFASHLILLGGEKMRWLQRNGEVVLLEILHPPVSDTLDRFSRYSRWQIVRTRDEVEKRLNQHYQIGRLIDLKVNKRGASGRVTELAVTGSENCVTVKGFTVRNVLGLRDTLFVIDKAYSESGEINRFTFSGRGWGHGVGLCQVGAYGMALAGANYHNILRKFYKGIKFEKQS